MRAGVGCGLVRLILAQNMALEGVEWGVEGMVGESVLKKVVLFV